MIGTRRQRRVLRHAAIVFGVSALFGLLFFAFRPFASANWRLTDQLFLPGEVSPNVVVVSVDDETLAQLTEKAQSTFWKRRTRRRQFQDKYGRVIGWFIWRVSLLTNFKVVASLKRRLVEAKTPARLEEGGTC